ncbi:MAG TPA: bifunctional phosphoribosyl-AMP cyclohydrolase/phosphoribosyl-ATP diphosphatase HisIE [Hellea balneolensis]|uniref:Histidine biosynthesis bifunctional protein HisIE n=1 Tax=Hellea balneolensis TaxID=287478 RepID=A0A7C3C613_9PROT|nr:bifunctional phosphoribosyl-AMP cyclohydrolase/phosphoribosyl-ATP diphosphatase HisIE [Hellea balneolensis]
MNIDWKKLSTDPSKGLLPAIVQDADTLQVLMLGYMNEEAVVQTRSTGFVTFYSRSRQTLWQKGETSGNVLRLVDMQIDCDADTLLVKARPVGPTCHEGTVSCFGMQGASGLGWLATLSKLIEERKTVDADTSYTASLLRGPLPRLSQKVGEEGVETVIAALAGSQEELIGEASDLLYHLMVLLAAKDLSLDDIVKQLQARSA